MRRQKLLLYFIMWTALAGCAPTTLPTPTATIVSTALPDICDKTNGTYHLVAQSTAVSSWPPADESSAFAPLSSPDGRYGLRENKDKLYLHAATGGEDIVLAPAPFYSYDVHWSPDSRHIAVGEIDYDNDRLNVTIYDLIGHSLALNSDFDRYASFEWSPNNRYLLFQSISSSNSLAVWDWNRQRTTFTLSGFYLPQVEWSPDGAYFAYYWRDDRRNDVFKWGYGVAATDGSHNTQFSIPKNAFNEGLGDGFRWSPDSQHIAFFYHFDSSQALNPRVVVYEREGGEVLSLPRDTVIARNILTLLPVYWSPDGASLLMWQTQGDKRYRLAAYPVINPRPDITSSQIRLTKISRLPYDAPSGERTALYNQRGHHYSITLMDADGGNSVSFISSASDAGDPNWSEDGRFVAAVWATESEHGRQVQLSWSDPYGENRHDIGGQYLDIRGLQWVLNRDRLLYVGVMPGNEFRVEVADLTTGSHQVLRDGLSNVEFLNYDPQTQLYTFVWHTFDGEFGFAGYGTDSLQQFDYANIEHINGLFPSPDEQFIAVKGRAGSNEALLLADADGRTQHALASGLSGLGDPLWSPDGELLAFTQQTAWGVPPTLRVFSVNGRELWSTDYNWDWSPLGWERC